MVSLFGTLERTIKAEPLSSRLHCNLLSISVSLSLFHSVDVVSSLSLVLFSFCRGSEPKQLAFSTTLGITLGIFPICGAYMPPLACFFALCYILRLQCVLLGVLFWNRCSCVSLWSSYCIFWIYLSCSNRHVGKYHCHSCRTSVKPYAYSHTLLIFSEWHFNFCIFSIINSLLDLDLMSFLLKSGGAFPTTWWKSHCWSTFSFDIRCP